jgi:FMNH2-dependent dimethyl sulfone monooxygenase
MTTPTQSGAAPSPKTAPKNAMFNANRMKLGTFGTNARGSAHTTAPDTHKPTWENTLRAAQMADGLGLEAILGLARWKGVVDGNPDHPSGVILDPFTWAAGLAQATTYSTLFPTTHAPTIHPIAIAKMTATIDIISGGRLGLNVVGGWNKPEFDMFGAALADHDQRYDYLDEWIGVLERLWTAEAQFDHQGRFLTMKGAVSRPQPLQQPRPVIMNAGGSGRGQRFACEHADMCFVSLKDDQEAVWKEQVDGYKTMARDDFGREIGVWGLCGIVQRKTRAEAEDYLNYYAVEHADEVAVASWHAKFMAEAQPNYTEEQYKKARARSAAAGGGQLLVGTAEDIADGLEKFSGAGVDGFLLAWNNFSDGLERFGEVLEIMEARGLREPFQAAGKS